MTKEQYQQIFKLYYNPLCNYVATHFDLSLSAEDIVMEVFTHIWQNIEKININEHPKSYLYTATYRKSIEVWRSFHKKPLVELTDNIVVPDNKEEIFDTYVLKEKLNESIRHLPTKCQLIFVKAKIEGMSHKQIAAELNISTKTIENQITKAFQLIRKDLKL